MPRFEVAASLLILVATVSGCRAYVESTPSETLEEQHHASYARVFGGPVPNDVTILHSVVVTYSFRPGVVTTDDFEFELLAPRPWIRQIGQRFYLKPSDSEFVQQDLDRRRKNARPWYAPEPLNHYDLYRDPTSVGYVHMLVRKEVRDDGRQRLFISKH